MKICLSLLLTLWSSWLLAQRVDVAVKVTDEKSNPLAGVSIALKKSVKVVITKEDGTATITVPDPKTAVLQVSYTGFVTKEVALEGKTSIAIALTAGVANLDEVIVVSALGLTRKAKSVTYSSQTVNAEVLTEARDVNIVNGLAGKAAGLQVTNTGQPGSSSRIVIRGEGSLTGNNQPLWVVDGVPIANNSSERNNLDYGNGAADLNPDDIESVEILKGPNAAALYGSMAANGAILVTTKKGKPGDKSLGIAINQNMMWYTITEFPAYQNIWGEGSGGKLVTDNKTIIPGTGAVNMGTNARSWGAPMLGQPYNDFSGKPIPGGYTPQPGNVTDFYKTSLTNVSNISISKADAISSFRLSYTYTKSDDVLENQNIRNKHNVSLYATRRLGSKVSVDARVLYTLDDTRNRTYRNLSASSPMAAYVFMARSANMAAFTPWTDAYGNANGLGSFSDTENPFWMLYENSNEDSRNRVIGGLTTTIELAAPLKLRLQAAGDLGFFKGYEYRELGGLKQKDGFYSTRMQDERNWNYEAMLQFNKRLNKNFTLAANIAANLASYNSLIRESFIDKLLTHDMPSLANSNAVPRVGESFVRRQVASVYGNATLGYKDLLFLDVTGRRDESTTLPRANRAYFYPSVGGSFVFSNFIKDRSILSYGKLRASWAKVGNAAPPYSLYNTWSNAGLFLSNPTLTYATRLNNVNLKPEQTISREIGIELSFFKQKASLTATVYKSNSTDQIITANTPTETGFTQRVVNAGEMQNKGIEISANVNVMKSKNFTWDVRANWSKNDNKVLSLVEGVPTLQLGSNLGATVNAIAGMPYGVLLGAIPYYVGDTILVQNNGRLYKEDNKYIGSYRADWLGSIGSTFKYKAFDFSFLVNVKWGGNLYSASYGRANTQGNTIESLEGRDDYFFSRVILEESDDERRGQEKQGSLTMPYADADRAKGRKYALSYLPKTDAAGNVLLDKNGRMIPGVPNPYWANPQEIGADFTLNNAAYITYNASSIRLSEVVLGYTVPGKILGNGFIKGVRVAAVGRNLWLLYRKTPRGIDPESANTSGNAQGIESGGSFPYAQYGIDFKMSF